MVNKDFFQAIEDFEIEKGIKPELLIDAIRTALINAYRKNTDDARDVVIDMDPEKNSVKFYAVRTVVEEVADPERRSLSKRQGK